MNSVVRYNFEDGLFHGMMHVEQVQIMYRSIRGAKFFRKPKFLSNPRLKIVWTIQFNNSTEMQIFFTFLVINVL